MNINAVLTNNEKLKNFNGQLLDKDCSTQILTEWINKDNILKYENIIHKLKLENITQEQFSTILNEWYRYAVFSYLQQVPIA